MGGSSKEKQQEASTPFNTNSEYSLPQELKDLTDKLHKDLLQRGYPLPPQLIGGVLVNTFEDRFDEPNDNHSNIAQAALNVSHSVVSLASFVGKTRLFACTGTVVGCMRSKMNILTSASLIRCYKDDMKIDDNLKIKVHLPNGKFVMGKPWMHDLHYNIAIVNIKAVSILNAAYLCYQLQTDFQEVISLGRGFESGDLMATSGTLVFKCSKFDCEELMVSTCKITKAGVGGPLIGFDGHLIGMNFHDNRETPFLPINIVLKCLKHFEIFGEVKHPQLGLRTRALHAKGLDMQEGVLYNLQCKDGIEVEKVIDESPAQRSGLEVGDIITEVDGVNLSHPRQFCELILDKIERTWQIGEAMCLKVFVIRPKDGTNFLVTMDAEVISMTNQNRWPVPRANWVYPDMDSRKRSRPT